MKNQKKIKNKTMQFRLTTEQYNRIKALKLSKKANNERFSISNIIRIGLLKIEHENLT